MDTVTTTRAGAQHERGPVEERRAPRGGPAHAGTGPAGPAREGVRIRGRIAGAARDRVAAVRGRVAGTTRDAGLATAEYAIVMIAAVGFAGLLVVILSSGEVREALTSLVRSALSV